MGSFSLDPSALLNVYFPFYKEYCMQIIFLKGINSIICCIIHPCFFMCLYLPFFFFMIIFVSYRSMYHSDFFISLSAVCFLLQLEAVVHLYQNNIWKTRRNTELNLISHNLLAIQFFRVLMTKNLMRVKPRSLIY